jgi:hypothetical protein
MRKEICMSIGKGAAARCAESHSARVGGALFVVCAALSMLLNRRLGVPPLRAESAEKCENKRKTPAHRRLSITTKRWARSAPMQLFWHSRRPCCWIKLFQLSRHLALAQVNSAFICEINIHTLWPSERCESRDFKESYWRDLSHTSKRGRNSSGRFWY